MTHIMTSKSVSQGHMLSVWPAGIPATCTSHRATRHAWNKGTSYNSECFRKTSGSNEIVTVPAVWASARQRVLVQCIAVNDRSLLFILNECVENVDLWIHRTTVLSNTFGADCTSKFHR